MVEKQSEEEYQVIKRVEEPTASSKVSPPPTVRSQSSHRSRRMRYFATVAGVSLLMGFGGGLLGTYVANNNESKSQAVTKQVISSESQLISSIAKDVGPSVVSVNVNTTTTQTDIFGRTYSAQGQAAGTGIIVSSDGYIVTNRHVVDSGTTKVSITLSDGTTFDNVAVIGRTTDTDSLDIAILKIQDAKGRTFTPAKLGDSSKLQVGDKVVAIGNALGQFQNTVTSGIVSGYGRSIEAGDSASTEVLQNLIQTDAAINSGNSGGPLVNTNGEVIGINTAVASGTAQNIGFAIPIDDVTGLVNSVVKTGKFQRPYLGVRYITLSDSDAATYNLSIKRGAYLAPDQSGGTVISGGPADKAGLKEKDIITKVNGTSIDENTSLSSLIGRKAVGDKVTLTIVRDGKEISVSVTLDSYK